MLYDNIYMTRSAINDLFSDSEIDINQLDSDHLMISMSHISSFDIDSVICWIYKCGGTKNNGFEKKISKHLDDCDKLSEMFLNDSKIVIGSDVIMVNGTPRSDSELNHQSTVHYFDAKPGFLMSMC